MKYSTKVLLLDIDGVLVNSLTGAYLANVAIFQSLGLKPPTQEEYLFRFDAHNPMAYYRERGVTETEEWVWKKFLEHFNQHEHPIFEEVPEVLQSLHRSGIKLYYVTFGRSKAKVLNTFQKCGISDLFEGGAFECPSKDQYMIEVYEELGIEPLRCAMVGDQPTDIIDADKAGLGLRIGMARNAAGRKKLEPHPHTHIIESLTELYDIL